MPLPTFTNFIEAEAMELDGYRSESIKAASGGAAIKTSDTGTARAEFDGEAGNYFIYLATFDENDGESTLEVMVNGDTVETITLDSATASPGAEESNKVFYIIGPVALEAGDEISVTGMRDEDEVARIDSIELVPQAGPDEGMLIEGDSGDDSLVGGDGNDTIYGFAGEDTLEGNGGNDLLDGGADNDTISGGAGEDTLIGGDGDDRLIDAGGSSSISGGAGNDTLAAEGGESTIDAGEGNDQVLFIGAGGLALLGAGDDEIFGSDDHVNRTVMGGDGQDTLNGGAGDDSIDGGAGNERILGYDDFEDAIDDPQAGGRDMLLGGAGNDTIGGQVGQDTLYGGDDNDLLDGDAGSDMLFGENGDDTLIGGDQQDTLTGGTGADVFRVSMVNHSSKNYDTGDYRVDGITDFTPGEDKIDVSDLGYLGLGDGTGTTVDISYSSSTDRTYVKNREVNDDGYRFELYLDGDFRDELSEDDFIFSVGDGDIVGTEGDDEIIDGPGDNTIFALGGNDTVRYNAGNNTVYLGDGDDRVINGDNQAFNFIDGGSGNDFIVGEFGDDTLLGGDGDDSLHAGDDLDDSNFGLEEGGADSMEGGDGNDELYGEVGNDSLDGGSGSDTLHGGLGMDTLTGGSGADIFQFLRLLDSAKNYTTGEFVVDGITDFEKGTDKIDVSELGFTGLGDGNGTTLDFSYSSSTDRTYIKNREVGEEGFRFEVFIEGDQTDALDANDFIFAGGSGGNQIFGTEGDDSIEGTEDSDEIFGLGGNDTIFGGLAATGPNPTNFDTIHGGDGDDDIFLEGGSVVFGDAGNDTMESEGGPVTMDGGEGDDRIIGSNSSDLLLGGAGADTIIGTLDTEDRSSDTIDGGAGMDLLTGTAGEDVFIFSELRHSAKNYSTGDFDVDGITNFEAGMDTIDVTALGFTGLGDGNGTTLDFSYSSDTDRTYIKNRETDSDGYRFEVYVEGDQTDVLSTDDFLFA